MEHLSTWTTDELADRLDEVEADLAERLSYSGRRSFGDHQVEQKLAVEADWLQDELAARGVR